MLTVAGAKALMDTAGVTPSDVAAYLGVGVEKVTPLSISTAARELGRDIERFLKGVKTATDNRKQAAEENTPLADRLAEPVGAE